MYFTERRIHLPDLVDRRAFFGAERCREVPRGVEKCREVQILGEASSYSASVSYGSSKVGDMMGTSKWWARENR